MKELAPRKVEELSARKKIAYRIIMWGQKRGIYKARKDLVEVFDFLGEVANIPDCRFSLVRRCHGDWVASLHGVAGEEAYQVNGLGRSALQACWGLIDDVVTQHKEEEFFRLGVDPKSRRGKQNPEFCDHPDFETDVDLPEAILSDIPVRRCVECGERV